MGRRRRPEKRTARTPVTILFLLFAFFQIFPSCSPKIPTSRLPEPILDGHSEMLDLYWESWRLINQSSMHGNRFNQFPDSYLNPENRDVIDQWSTLSLALFAMYGYQVYPIMETLDLFYKKQRSDGFIARTYINTSGDPLHLPTKLDPMIHPPLFAWVELKYFMLSADSSRLRRVFPILENYYAWIDRFCRGKFEADDLYYNTPIGSGMMNLPRGDVEYGGWTDLSAQMALFAEQLQEMATILDLPDKVQYYRNRYNNARRTIQAKLWNPDSSFYYDYTSEGKSIKIRTIAAFWPLFAGIPDQSQAERLIGHLEDPDDFSLAHMFPSVSARDLNYDPHGFYWRGGVWGICDYMIIRGLMRYDRPDFARTVAWNHLENMASVYNGFDIAIEDSTLVTARDNSGKIWEMYAPEGHRPGTRWDAKNLCEANHISFSGHGPVSMFIENILGFQTDAPHDELRWFITRSERHGIRRLHFGDNRVSVWTEPQPEAPEILSIEGTTDSAVKLSIITEKDHFNVRFDPGPIEVSFIPENYVLRGRFIRG